eukprot:ANDGO_00940.mRNA.1 Myb-like protein J
MSVDLVSISSSSSSNMSFFGFADPFQQFQSEDAMFAQTLQKQSSSTSVHSAAASSYSSSSSSLSLPSRTALKAPQKRVLKQKHVAWTLEEDMLFDEGIRVFGKGRWSQIAAFIKTRTALQVKNHASTFFKRLEKIHGSECGDADGDDVMEHSSSASSSHSLSEEEVTAPAFTMSVDTNSTLSNHGRVTVAHPQQLSRLSVPSPMAFGSSAFSPFHALSSPLFMPFEPSSCFVPPLSATQQSLIHPGFLTTMPSPMKRFLTAEAFCVTPSGLTTPVLQLDIKNVVDEIENADAFSIL